MTRQLIATLFYSVDGVATSPNLFQHDSFDARLGELMTDAIGRITANIMGRVTYQEWAGYWPTQEDGPDAGFAHFINGTPRYIASTTLTQDDLTWANSTHIPTDLLSFVRELKETEGGTIAIQGSLSVIRQCVEAGLIDELTLIIHPAIAGGPSLFQDSLPTRLRLLRVEGTEKGNIVATYAPFEG